MPTYTTLITLKPCTPSSVLKKLTVDLMKSVVGGGGVVRGVDDLGTRKLPYPFKSPYPTADGTRMYTKARDIVMLSTLAPPVLQDLRRRVKADESVLRCTFVKEREEKVGDKFKKEKWGNWKRDEEDVRKIEEMMRKARAARAANRR